MTLINEVLKGGSECVAPSLFRLARVFHPHVRTILCIVVVDKQI